LCAKITRAAQAVWIFGSSGLRSDSSARGALRQRISVCVFHGIRKDGISGGVSAEVVAHRRFDEFDIAGQLCFDRSGAKLEVGLQRISKKSVVQNHFFSPRSLKNRSRAENFYFAVTRERPRDGPQAARFQRC
jgi:hypothetical protein